MRKFIAISMLTALALALAPAYGSDGGRTVTGTILVPTATVPAVGTFSRQVRCAYTTEREASLSGEASNGVFGYVIPLQGSEGNGTHAFTLTSTDANPGVVFYASLSTCDSNASVTGQFTTAGNEAGTIPIDTAYAVVIIEQGANASFTFTIA